MIRHCSFASVRDSVRAEAWGRKMSYMQVPVGRAMKLCISSLGLFWWCVVVFAAQHGTSLAEARAAIEANLRTPEGYDEKMGKEFQDKYLETRRQCKKTAGAGLESFWILLKIGPDGAVREVLLHPVMKLGSCSREEVLQGKFSRPPRADYWVGVYMKIAH